MPGRISEKEERVKKGEVIKLHPIPDEVRTELNRSEQESEAARISSLHKEKTIKPKGELVGNAKSLRERILSISLFPNIINKPY